MNHRVTVAILTHNRAGYLRQALEAAVGQTFRDIEILIFDNASTDETFQVVRAFNDPRILYLRQSVNKGVHGNYAEAALRSSGRYVLITHDDDIMEPTLVERQVALLDADPDCMAVSSNVSVINASGEILQPRLLPFQEDRVFEVGDYVKSWAESQLALPITSLMYRIKPGVGLHPKDRPPLEITVYGDIFSLSQLNLHGRIVLIADPLMRYRQHGQQDSFTDDLIHGGVLLHRHLYRLYRRKLPAALPYIRAGGLRYEVQQAVIQSKARLSNPATLTRKIRSMADKWAEVSLEPRERVLYSLSFELLKSYLGLPLHATGMLAFPPEGETPEAYLGAWLALRGRCGFRICDHLPLPKGAHIGILGSVFNAYLLGLDAVASGHTIVTFLDSNLGRQGTRLGGVPVNAPAWLKENASRLDVILLSSERERTRSLSAFLHQFLPADWGGQILGWRDAVRALDSLHGPEIKEGA